MAGEYSQATQNLIDRMIYCERREDFILDKPKAEECILKTYDLFNLKRPSRVVWLKDIFDKKYQKKVKLAWSARSAWSAWLGRSAWSAESARLARSAWSAGSAWSAESARLARSTWSTWSAWSAGSVWSAWSAGSAWSARSAGLARSTWSAGLAWSALDYDFNYYVFEFEYCQNPDENPQNDNDRKYLEYSELLLQAKEYGMGYRVEYKDTLYCVPTPLLLLDSQKRLHSLEKPAIRWKGGSEFYFIHGVNFPKDLWERVTNRKLSAVEILKLPNMEQRYIALKLYGASNLLKELKADLIDKSDRNELYGLSGIIPDKTIKMLRYFCPTTKREYVKFIPYQFEKADEAQAWSFSLTLREYNNLIWEA